MKLTKFFHLVFIFLFLLSSKIYSDELREYFEKVLNNEKKLFLECVKSEKLSEVFAIKTKCPISKNSQEAFYILNKRELTKYDFLDDFSPPKSIKKITPMYPKNDQLRDIQGYVILKYDLDIDGKPFNIRRVEGKCGNPRVTIFFRDCINFYKTSEAALKRFVYKPAQYKNDDVKSTDNLHRFSFILDYSYEDISKIVKKTDLLIERKEFDKALEIAKSKKEKIFQYQIGRIYFEKQNYQEASYWFNEFLENIGSEYPPQRIIVNSVIFLIQSLFNSEMYDEIAIIDKSLDVYFKSNAKYDEAFALTNFYIGASFINQGNLNRGLYYFSRAKESTTDERIIKTIEDYTDQLSAFL